MKKIPFSILPSLLLMSFVYIFPYPGPMPGNTLYKVMTIVDVIQGITTWGSIAKTRYNLSLSDKYLIEAKTLFEYKQYLLGIQALNKSDTAMKSVPDHIVHGFLEGKDLSLLTQTVISANEAHVMVIEKLKNELPESFTWTPEKDNATDLLFSEQFTTSIDLRKGIMNDLTYLLFCLKSISSTQTPWKTHTSACWNEKNKFNQSFEQDQGYL